MSERFRRGRRSSFSTPAAHPRSSHSRTPRPSCVSRLTLMLYKAAHNRPASPVATSRSSTSVEQSSAYLPSNSRVALGSFAATGNRRDPGRSSTPAPLGGTRLSVRLSDAGDRSRSMNRVAWNLLGSLQRAGVYTLPVGPSPRSRVLLTSSSGGRGLASRRTEQRGAQLLGVRVWSRGGSPTRYKRPRWSPRRR